MIFENNILGAKVYVYKDFSDPFQNGGPCCVFFAVGYGLRSNALTDFHEICLDCLDIFDLN